MFIFHSLETNKLSESGTSKDEWPVLTNIPFRAKEWRVMGRKEETKITITETRRKGRNRDPDH